AVASVTAIVPVIAIASISPVALRVEPRGRSVLCTLNLSAVRFVACAGVVSAISATASVADSFGVCGASAVGSLDGRGRGVVLTAVSA
ncbi:MAG: hypothetical protein ABJF01_25780, partial [bacterium]